MAACEGAFVGCKMRRKAWKHSRFANCYTAIEQGLEVLPVLNKIDLPQAEPERVIQEIEDILVLKQLKRQLVRQKQVLGLIAF